MEHLISLSNRQNAIVFRAMDATKLSINQILIEGANAVLERAGKKYSYSSANSFGGDEKLLDLIIERDFNISKENLIPVSELKSYLKHTTKRKFSQKMISDCMKRKGFTATRKYIYGVQVRSWLGLRLKDNKI